MFSEYEVASIMIYINASSVNLIPLSLFWGLLMKKFFLPFIKITVDGFLLNNKLHFLNRLTSIVSKSPMLHSY